MVNKHDKDALRRGLLDGLKRVDVRRARDDVSSEIGSYAVGYGIGFLGKTLLVLVASYYGLQLPA